MTKENSRERRKKMMRWDEMRIGTGMSWSLSKPTKAHALFRFFEYCPSVFSGTKFHHYTDNCEVFCHHTCFEWESVHFQHNFARDAQAARCTLIDSLDRFMIKFFWRSSSPLIDSIETRTLLAIPNHHCFWATPTIRSIASAFNLPVVILSSSPQAHDQATLQNAILFSTNWGKGSKQGF